MKEKIKYIIRHTDCNEIQDATVEHHKSIITNSNITIVCLDDIQVSIDENGTSTIVNNKDGTTMVMQLYQLSDISHALIILNNEINNSGLIAEIYKEVEK